MEGEVLFVKPKAQYDITDRIRENCAFAKQMSQLVEFVDDKTAKELKKALNQCIREGVEIDLFENSNLLSLWKLVRSIKNDLLAECYSAVSYTHLTLPTICSV